MEVSKDERPVKRQKTKTQAREEVVVGDAALRSDSKASGQGKELDETGRETKAAITDFIRLSSPGFSGVLKRR